MSHFIFKAKKPSGEVYSAEKDAADRYELYRMVRETGDEMVEFKEHASGGGFKVDISLGFLTNHVKAMEKINFARNLGAMLQAGLALSRALMVIERQSHNQALKKVITTVIGEIDKGSAFAEALSKHPKVFPPLFISMVHAG